LIVADHCNISCRNCNHASPLMTRWFADPNIVYRDLSIMAKLYRPQFVKVLGGEPLMHKNLDEVIVAARASGICDNFVLTTNGTLLDKASDAVWELVDEVQMSLYPGQTRATDNLKIAEAKAKFFDKKLTVNRYEQFHATFSTKGTSDKALVHKIYSTCKIANFWGCHTVREGYFYKCPPSIYIPRLTGRLDPSDRLEITESSSFQSMLLEFINSPSPLSACTNCLGTAGILEDHEPMPRAEWHAHMEQPSEELIDFDYLDLSMSFDLQTGRPSDLTASRNQASSDGPAPEVLGRTISPKASLKAILSRWRRA
jgi:cyclic pyranopterin phosphate synthase